MNSEKINKKFKILLMDGDGIGPEIMRQVKRLLPEVKKKCKIDLKWEEASLGAKGIKQYGSNLPEETWDALINSDAILSSCVGDPKYDYLELIEQPAAAMLKLRKRLKLYANLRPLTNYKTLMGISPLKGSIINEGINILIVRELTGGLYFGPHGREDTPEGNIKAFDTMLYYDYEVKRIAKIAFEAASRRKNHLTSVDKANVLSSSRLWREIVENMQSEYPSVSLDSQYVDAFAMNMVKKPTEFDVVLSSNVFGDIISDLGSVLVGSLGMLPSVSLGDKMWNINGKERIKPWLYEPVHGSAPDIKGMDKANPIALILSLALVFRHSLEDEDTASAIENAVEDVLITGYRTPEIYQNKEGEVVVGTDKMGEEILASFIKLIK